jgi:hypothetical protein
MNKPLRMLDLFCGQLGWTRAFLEKGWDCVAVDVVKPPELPTASGFEFVCMDVRQIQKIGPAAFIYGFDFICASPPCEQFSVHCMKFLKKKDHPYPALGIQLFNHTRQLCEESRLPYIIENVRCAQQFVGQANAHADAFYLWGNSIPPLLPKGLVKMGNQGGWRRGDGTFRERDKTARIPAAISATIPPELAHCVADYAW